MLWSDGADVGHGDAEEYLDLDQLGIYLANYATARLWLQRGTTPDLLLGHSFGELAAFAVAGIYRFEDGARLVCQRVLSLREAAGSGRMAAVAAPAAQVRAALDAFAKSSAISVINHSGQTVVSGPEGELAELRDRLARQAVSVTMLKSRYPFHSSLLSAASRAFGIAARGYRFEPPCYPVYVGTEQRLVDDGMDLADAMARQLVSPLDFEAAVRGLAGDGYRRFLECGAGTIVTKIVGRVLRSDGEHREWATFPTADEVDGRLRQLGMEISSTEPVVRATEPAPSVAADLPVAPARPPAAVAVPEPSPFEPIAIVAMGCVLPGGADQPEQFWRNITAGVSGIVDLTASDPDAREDFVAGRVDGATQEIVTDKTYTLLNGSVTGVAWDGTLLGGRYTDREFAQLTKGQQILAISMAQVRLPGSSEKAGVRVQCILGSTADGSAELDEAHFAASVREVLDGLDGPLPAKKAFSEVLSNALPGWKRKPEDLTPHALCADVAQRVLGVAPVHSYLVDSACSSSLYSLALGARALRTREADLVYAGGVFAPGPANNNLFAQFRGLTPNESRPFDARADGVVFGDGAGILALKRLSDAIDDGDRILGIIRSEGFSSDGKSPSINVPQMNGQAMAIHTAYARAALDPASVQYVEAHATATPVGDAVEFQALRAAFPSSGHSTDGACRLLGSVKSLIGHTGWTSGVASVIKICKALEHGRIPRQFGYSSPNPGIELNGSGFAIPIEERDWPANADGLPRRAGLNGFGFGGTNAHFVIEEYLEPYHRTLAARFRGQTPALADIVVVAAEGLLPDGGRSFDRARLRMPKKRLVLPDVAEHMDASQYLATMAAERIADSLPAGLGQKDLRIGVALGLESKTERGVRANERVFLDRLSRVARSAGASPEMLGCVRKAITTKVIPSGPYTLPGLMPNVAAGRITHTFNWHGPNIVVDRGKGSLVQALDAGLKFVQAGDCEIVLAGAVNAWAGHNRESREAVTLVAFATAETAATHKLPILARVQRSAPPPDAVQVVLDAGDPSYCGAAGSVELLEAIREVSTKSTEIVLVSRGVPLLTLVPASGRRKPAVPPTDERRIEPRPEIQRETQRETPLETIGSHAYVQGTPITNYTPVLVDTPALEVRGPATGRSYLFLTDQPEAWHEFELDSSLRELTYTVATPSSVKIAGAHRLDVSTEETLRESLERLRPVRFDTIVAISQLSRVKDEDLLLADFAGTRGLLDVLFGLCRHRYEDIAARRCAVATICLGALRTGELDAFTGLFGGFVKSLKRELPEAACKAMVTDGTRLVEALGLAASELDANDSIAEVVYRGGRRLRSVLTRSEPLHREGPPWASPASVVLVTGGGRGVTAVLAEYLMRAHGCTVIALGRTDPGYVPEDLRRLDEAAFQAYEPQFYREQLAKDRSKKMPELKQLYERYQASHELLSVIHRSEALPGKYEYIRCDVTDPSSIDRVVEDVLVRHGRLDLVVHGAGVQVSKILARKKLEDFQRVVTTKLASLGHLYKACHQRGIHTRVHFHILTSAFSYLGNDGQSDYGAANEAMNRLAGRMNLVHPGSYWSSLAWLGWAGIGMTRGTEYAALAASRRLRGVTREEGQQIFGDAMAGPPASPVNILLADGEVAFYRPEISHEAAAVARAAGQPTSERIVEWSVGPETMPFLSDHVVRGVPTVPGAFIIAMAADAAHKLRPDLKVVQFERTRFLRLVRGQEGRPAQVRAIAKIVEQTSDETVIQVQIVMDFVHKSGRVLGRDLLHTEIYVRMASIVRQPTRIHGDADHVAGVLLPDPYVMAGSPVQLNGAFKTMKEVEVGRTSRRADYKLNGNSHYGSDFDYLIPNVILVDAFWRFGTVRANGNGGLSVYVPERCDSMKVFFDYADFDAPQLRSAVTFHGANPRADGDVLHVGPIDAFDSTGRMLLRVEGGVCRKFGDIEVH